MLDLNTMALFASIAAEGSFAAASRALGVPTSTLSRKVSQLEEEVGTRLLQRSSRKLTLTDAGQRFLAHCRKVVDEARAAEDALRGLQTAPRGTLRITTSPLFGDLFLGPIVAEYVTAHPGVDLEIIHAQAAIDLLEEQIDLAIRIRERPFDDSSLVARRLGPAPLVLCASPAYVAERGSPATPAELTDHRCVVVGDATGGATWRIDTDDGVIACTIHPRVRVNTYPIALRAVLGGAGIARLPAFIATDHLARGELVRVLPALAERPRTVYAVYPSRRNLPLTVRTFVDLLVDRMVPVLAAWSE